tara:strand:- start:357 stop:833 length:477 start_codon:yes stop_codon:yes gene_type:complete
MASGTTNLTVNEAAYGRTAYYKFDYLDLQTSGYLSSGASGLIGAANQVLLDIIAPGEIVSNVTIQAITAAAGDTDFTVDIGTLAVDDPDNLIDAAVLGGRTANQSFSSTASDTASAAANTGGSNVGLLIEFGSLTAANLTAGEWVIAWNVSTAPIDYV